MSKFRLILTTLIALLLLTTLFSGCTQVSSSIPGQTTQNDERRWFVDSNGHFHTYDVILAQKEIPFTIVVPDYIPDLFGNDYLCEITGPFKNPLDNYIEVKIQYWDENHQIYISEYNKKIIVDPIEELEPANYEIAGIKVLRQITQLLGSSGTIEGLSFSWNTDDITFMVKIFNITEEEGLKIVESMIKQLNNK